MAAGILDLVFRTKKTGTGARDAKKELTDLQKGFQGLQSAAGLLTAGAGAAVGAVVAVGAAVKSVVDPTVEYAKQVRDLNRAIGGTPEETSKLIQAADDVGISYGTLTTAMEAAIKRGVSPTVAGMADLADEYVSIQDPIARTKFLMDKFGRSGADLGPLMELGAAGIRELGEAAEESGLVMDAKAVAAAREYEIAMDNLEDSALALKIELANGLIPVLTQTAEGMSKWLGTERELRQAVDEGNISADERAAIMYGVRGGAVELTDVQEYLEEVERKQTAAVDASAARWQGLADTYNTQVTPATETLISAEERLALGMQKYNEQLLFKLASEGLDAEASLRLADAMGLLDDQTLAAAEGVQTLKDKYDTNRDGAISAGEATAGYYGEVLQLKTAVDSLQDKTVNVRMTTTYQDVYLDAYREATGSGRADGGPVWGGGAFMVGERGPEMFVPAGAGRIVPNEQMPTAGGVTEETARRLIETLKRLPGEMGAAVGAGMRGIGYAADARARLGA